MSTHPRQLDLERLAAGEAVTAAAHVDACPECQAVVTEIREASRAFVARHPPRSLHEAASRRPEWWRAWWPVALLPIAAAVAFVVLAPEPPERRLKGSGLTLFVTRGGAPVALGRDERVSEGDQLTFQYEATAPGHLLLLDVERGKAPVVLAAPPKLLANSSFRAPLAFELDASTAEEWIVAIFAPAPVSPEVLTLPAQGAPLVTCADCLVEVRRLERAR